MTPVDPTELSPPAAGGGALRALAGRLAGLLRPEPSPRSPAAARALAQEEVAGLGYMLAARLAALGVMAVWVLATLPIERSGLYFAVIAAFAALGVPPWLLARRAGAASAAAAPFLMLDAALLAYVLIFPDSYATEGWTPQLNLRLPSVLYVAVFLVSVSLSHSPRLVLLTGLAAIGAWTAGVLRVAAMPGAVVQTSVAALQSAASPEEVVADFLDPAVVSLTALYNQLMALGLITLILAMSVWRSRRLVRRSVEAETQRLALSRYFSPELIGQLEKDPGALDRPTRGPAAVLFADMVGFTTICERMGPEALVAFLGEFHARLARAAFDHGGTVDKYLGDAIMVHFGTPRARPDDAARALACAGAMLAAIDRWNRERAARGEPAVEIGVGLHHGEVLAGNIGDARRVEYTVLGDVVNVASRLEKLCRDLDARLVVSDACVEAARAAGAEPLRLVPGLVPDASRQVRGRSEPVAVWRL